MIGGADRRALHGDDTDQLFLRIHELARSGDAAPEQVTDVALERRAAGAFLGDALDIADSRRRVLHLSDSGQRIDTAIIGSFIAREKALLETLDPGERRELVRLFGKIIAAVDAWAKPYRGDVWQEMVERTR